MRVFVFGAGASLHVGYPLTKDLCPKLIEWASRNEPANELYWPDPDELSRIGSLDDIEELVSRVEKVSRPGPVLAGLRNALCGYFDSIRANDAALYRQFAQEVVQRGDVLVSFNYDVSLDRELRRARKWEMRDGYGFDMGITESPRSPVKLLKLHGSTNWIDLLFGGARGGSSFGVGAAFDSRGLRPAIMPQETEFLEYPGIRDPQFTRGGVDRAGSMVLPSRDKRFYVGTSVNPREREDFWTDLWAQAAEALRGAAEIVVIGYSLPTADEQARNLFFDAELGGCVTVCCRGDNKRLAGEFRQHGFKNVRTDLQCFENLLDVLGSTKRPQGEPCLTGSPA